MIIVAMYVHVQRVLAGQVNFVIRMVCVNANLTAAVVQNIHVEVPRVLIIAVILVTQLR
jgi:hypothetical protein